MERKFKYHTLGADERGSLSRRFVGLQSRSDISTEAEVFDFVGTQIPMLQPVNTTDVGKSGNWW
jgi:hypothetical protein